MSSLKSLAAAKNRRSGEQQTHVTSGMRPGTSIGSHAAFANTGRGQPQQRFQEPVAQQNGLPFSKLTVSDAIGLITLRLGKVEQYLIDVQQEGGGFSNNASSSIPDNMKLIDNSVLTSMVNRLDSLEKKEVSTNQPSSELLGKLEKELKETKEMLVNLMFKFELFTKETNDRLLHHENKFIEHENIFTEIESTLQQENRNDCGETVLGENVEENVEQPGENETIFSAELKNLIKQEFSTSENE